MKDFDFDELDRAVSSVLGEQAAPSRDDVAVGRSAAMAPENTSTPERPVSIDVPERSDASQAEVARRDIGERPVVQRPAGPRSMDIVRRSSSSNQSAPLTALPLPVEPPVQEVPVKPRTVVTMNDITAVPRAEMEQEAVPTPQAVESEPVEDTWTPPVDSPFLPDAKVEKRPLGTSEPTGDIGFIESKLEEAIGQPESPVAEPELAVETVDPGLVPMSDPEAESVPEFDAVALEGDDLPLTEVAEPAVLPSPVADVSEYSAPVAITPQYTPKPDVEPEASGEIFDTESYHQPFAVQKKKKTSSLKVVLIVTLIVLFGAAAGAGVYFYVLPML